MVRLSPWKLRICALGQLGDVKGAAQAHEELRERRPNFDPRTEIAKWNAAPGDAEHLVEGWQKAGFLAPDAGA